jgi:hypothetical protein
MSKSATVRSKKGFAVEAGVVHEHVDAPELVGDLRYELFRNLRVGEVAVDPFERALQLVERPFQLRRVAGRRIAERVAVCEEARRDGEPDAGVRAGDESDLAVDALNSLTACARSSPSWPRRPGRRR